MTPETPAEGRSLSRRRLLEAGLGLGIGAALPAGAAAATRPAKRRVQGASKSLVIGAFEDGALVPFKQKIIPLFKHQTGISIELLTEPYDSFFAKAFDDGQTKAGQYDIYIMDDPWVPQYAAAGILENLGKHGVKADEDYARPFIELGYWPPRSGPRIKGFSHGLAAAHRAAHDRRPADDDLPQGHLRSAPKTWTELVTKATAAQKARQDQVRLRLPRRQGQPDRHARGTRSSCPSAASSSTTMERHVQQRGQGKAAADFFVTTLKALAPPGVAEFDSDQEGAAILGGQAAAIIQYTGNAIKSDDPKQSKEVGKLDFAVVPKQEKAIAQIGIFIHGVSASAPNKDNAITFMKWFAHEQDPDRRRPGGRRAGQGRRRSRIPAAVKAHRLLPVALQQLQAGCAAAAAHAGLVARSRRSWAPS